jgi:protein TonB
MSDLKTIVPKPERLLAAHPHRNALTASHARRQRELMVGSLCLLLLALSIVLWHDRDFWFPDSRDEADTDQPVQSAPVASTAPAREPAPVVSLATPKSTHKPAHSLPKTDAATPPPAPTPPVDAPAVAMTNRTVLPPLEVEVVAGDTHKVIRPGSSSVRVDMQPGSPPQATSEAATVREADTPANITSNAAERVQMSADTSAMVASTVKPSYPMLARQMKVQGSVILQALIGKDGVIQNLRVVSGPHILASAAQDAVRQWHFKPHVEGAEAVETQAKITVNFTISTN